MVASVLFAAAAAFACTNLATLSTSAAAAKSGGVVTLSGSSFAAAEEGVAPSPVLVHWNKVDGPVLATLVPDAKGAVTGSVTLPTAEPGHYVLIATQVDEEGENQFGTPARVPLEVLSASGESVAPADVQTSSSSSSGSDTSVPLVLVVMLGVVSVGVFAAGLASFRKGGSPRPAPAITTTEPDREPAQRS